MRNRAGGITRGIDENRSSRRLVESCDRRRKEKVASMTSRNAFAIALAATLLMATGAQAQSYPPDIQAPRTQDVQSPRGDNEDLQAPRGANRDVQTPRG
jgi:hypothetical protein